VRTSSGKELDADVIVTATGLKLQILAGIPVIIDGERYRPEEKYAWNGQMLQGAPNLTYVFGYGQNPTFPYSISMLTPSYSYATASWTLGADNTATSWIRTLKKMQQNHYTSVVPEVEDESKLAGKETSFLDLNSTYVATGAKGVMPKVTTQWPWMPRTNVIMDRFYANYGDMSTGLQFNRVAVD
jgi:hypothetical protein